MERIVIRFKIFNISDKPYVLNPTLFVPISSVLFVMVRHKTEYRLNENI